MANLSTKASASPVPAPTSPPPITPEKVVANFSLATSQLIELIGECKDSGKKSVELSRQLNGIEDRMTSIERKIVELPHPPQVPHHLVATTADLGKAMDSVKEEYSKEMMSIKTQLSELQTEVKSLREDREATLKEMFAVNNGADDFRTAIQSAVSKLVKGVIEVLRNLDSQVSAVQKVIFDKK